MQHEGSVKFLTLEETQARYEKMEKLNYVMRASLVSLALEAEHYRATGRGEQFLLEAIKIAQETVTLATEVSHA
jgi:hypothetical protein